MQVVDIALGTLRADAWRPASAAGCLARGKAAARQCVWDPSVPSSTTCGEGPVMEGILPGNSDICWRNL